MNQLDFHFSKGKLNLFQFQILEILLYKMFDQTVMTHICIPFTHDITLTSDNLMCPATTVHLNTAKKVLVFDMDETLTHSSYQPIENHLNSMVFNLNGINIYVYERPNASNLLYKLQKMFNLFIFTAGNKEYADPIISNFFSFVPEDHRLFRDSCRKENNKIYKDLYKFRRPMNEVIIVEDCLDVIGFFPRNTIIIPSFQATDDDNIFGEILGPILEKCSKEDDVRPIIAQNRIVTF
ncbi:NLI interacting factor-like phosphatase family protein [Tritrichomonas foetus]|uniref:Mitochondrial import inner membrane translocase subunit TIM50 n=1 Tax=Tritrichomonas foetus TaxID=1144522 RepID=A0A1J4JE13_9EUKA|nr:NLI interacting factor-like phosphatase family protein [Tritrichomonas foetus]|eukprot:OHS97438.1 NLI interacting factor-like phosphatase family protein [Tritrichomonas foetus]